MEYEIRDGKVYNAPGKATTLTAELGFHFSHANRHLAMIEALRGLADQDGTMKTYPNLSVKSFLDTDPIHQGFGS